MRVQIYEEEYDSVELVRTSRNGESFFGLRIWLKTPQVLLDHSTAEDDHRCAVTIWARQQKALLAMVDRMGTVLVNVTFSETMAH